MKTILIVVLVCFVICDELPTVTELDVFAYLGDWWEVASSPIVHLTSERNMFCSKTYYSYRNDLKISVHNFGREGGFDGSIREVNGYAYQTDPVKFPGKLKLNLNLPFEFDYWIVKTGPIVNNFYEYAIVSEPYKQFMWVLARDPSTYFQKYGDENKNYLVNELGFNGVLNKYVERNNTLCVPYLWYQK